MKNKDRNKPLDKPDFQDLETLADMITSPPYHQLMGYKLGRADPRQGSLEIRQAFSSDLRRMQGSDQIHGGVIAALIDVAATFAMISYLNKGVPTVDLRVDYLRPAAGSELVASASVRKAGRTVGTVDVEVHDEAGRMIALGRALFATGQC